MSHLTKTSDAYSSTDVQTLTGNSGGIISPTLGNINIVGSGSTTVAGNPGTSTLTISVADQTLTGNSGGAVSPTLGNINVVGSGGVTVSGNPGTSTLTVSVSGSGITWNEVLGTSQAMLVDNGYVANNVALVTLTLPATSVFGSVIQVVGKGAGLWKIAQNAGQTIHFGAFDTTTGVGGYLGSTAMYDCVELLCITADTDWIVTSSMGNITYV